MRKILLLTLIFTPLFLFAPHTFAAGCTGTGNCYWVGGTGNANDTAHWATTDGGATTGGLPAATDTCNFTNQSSTANAAYTFTVNAATTCLDFVMAGPGGGNKVTWAGSSALAISGSLNLSGGTAGITNSYTGTLTFNAATGTKTITSNGIIFTSSVFTFSGVSGATTFQIADTFNNSTNNVSVVGGTIDFNSKTVTMGNMSTSGNNSQSFNLGAADITNRGWNISATNGTVINASTATITVNNGGSFQSPGTPTYGTVIMNLISATAALSGTNTFSTLTINGNAGPINILNVNADQTVTGTVTFSGNSEANRLLIQNGTAGVSRGISAGMVSASYVDFKDINGTGSGSWNLSSVTGNSGDCGGNTGITFTPATTQHWINTSGGNWSTVANWTSHIPLCQDTVLMDAAFGVSVTVTFDVARTGDLDWSGATWTTSLTWTPTLNLQPINGGIKLASGMSMSGGTQLRLIGRGNYNLTNNGVVFSCSVIYDAPTGTLNLLDDYSNSSTAANGFGIINGTYKTNAHNITVQNTVASSASVIVNGGTLDLGNGSTFTISGNWSTAAAATIANASGSTIKFVDTSNTNQTFTGQGKTYGTLYFSRGASTGSITISGSNTFSGIKDDGTAAHSLLFTAATTQNIGAWNVSGSAGKLITINSTNTSTFNLNNSSSQPFCSNYLSIQHSIATGAGRWFAGVNSTNNQSVVTAGSGWNFYTCGKTSIFGGTTTIRGGTTTIK